LHDLEVGAVEFLVGYGNYYGVIADVREYEAQGNRLTASSDGRHLQAQ
jgi:hypothetical protein